MINKIERAELEIACILAKLNAELLTSSVADVSTSFFSGAVSVTILLKDKVMA